MKMWTKEYKTPVSINEVFTGLQTRTHAKDQLNNQISNEQGEDTQDITAQLEEMQQLSIREDELEDELDQLLYDEVDAEIVDMDVDGGS